MTDVVHEDLCPLVYGWAFELDKPKSKWTTAEWHEYNNACKCWLIRKTRGAYSKQLIESVAINCLRDKHKAVVHLASNEVRTVLCDTCRAMVDVLRSAEVLSMAKRCYCSRCIDERATADRAAGAPWSESLGSMGMMVLCETCGNKRCPHATFHGNECTGSNEPNQPGSAYFFVGTDE